MIYSLRELRYDDIDALQDYLTDEETVKYLPGGKNSRDDTMLFIKTAINMSEESPRKQYHLAVCNDRQLIGNCSLIISDNRYEASLGYVINRKFTRMGAATYAAKELINYGFTELNLHRIYAVCTTDNIASYRVMEKCGMTKEAHFRKTYPEITDDGYRWKDEYLYSVLKEEWKILQ